MTVLWSKYTHQFGLDRGQSFPFLKIDEDGPKNLVSAGLYTPVGGLPLLQLTFPSRSVIVV